MRRMSFAAALAAALTVGLSSVAVAAPSKAVRVTGGQTQLTLSAAAVQALSTYHITPAPLAPATASGATLSFPVSGGRLNLATVHGVIRHRGGFSLSNGKRTVAIRELTILASGKTADLWGLVRTSPARTRCTRIGPGHRHVRCYTLYLWHSARIAHITNVTVSNGTATGDAALTAASAGVINRLAGTQVAKAGLAIGTVKVTLTVS